MNTILDKIIATKKEEVKALKKRYTYQDFESSEYFQQETKPFASALKRNNFGIIAELKRRSPSAGIINANLDIIKQSQSYETAGAAAISCLTDSTYFGGSTDDLTKIHGAVHIPILRKDFIIDEMQLFESKAIGADAILLIAEVLTKEEALHLTIMAQSLGMEVVMEFHHQEELYKINDCVDIIGINNRDLRRQETDIQKSYDLFKYLPKDGTFISESGIKTGYELRGLYKCGFHGALIGESILEQGDPTTFIQSLNTKINAA
ncbi:MAG: indole-3-glycerol phosphate synthase [Flavobacteriaceae bacterium]|jgi:indole-3-glycerol phosphate synthase